jgi:hypothetical protein
MKRKEKIAGLVVFLLATFSITTVAIFNIPVSQDFLIKGPFPDPFVFENGTRVTSEADWNLRRDEIKSMMMDIQYGNMPGRPDAMNATIVNTETRTDNSTYKEVILTIIPFNTTPASHFNFTLDIYTPNGTGPFPAICKVSKDGQGTQVPNNQTITDRGYIYACFHHTDLDPDENGVIGVI